MINWIDSYHDPQLDGYGSATKAMDPGGVDPDPYPTIKLGLDLNLEKLDHIRKMRNNQIQIRTSKNWTRSEPWETTKSGSELWKTNRIRTPSNKFTLNFFSVNLEVNIRITNYLYYNLGRWILKEKLDSNIILENFEPWFADRIRFFSSQNMDLDPTFFPNENLNPTFFYRLQIRIEQKYPAPTKTLNSTKKRDQTKIFDPTKTTGSATLSPTLWLVLNRLNSTKQKPQSSRLGVLVY